MKIKSQNTIKENKYPTFEEYNLSLINKKTLIKSLKLSITLILTPLMIMSCNQKPKTSPKNADKLTKIKLIKNVDKSTKVMVVKDVGKTQENLIEKGFIQGNKRRIIETSGVLGMIGSTGPLSFRYNEIDDDEIKLPDEN